MDKNCEQIQGKLAKMIRDAGSKKQKENIPKKKMLRIMHKIKKVQKKSQESIIKTFHMKKKTRLKSTKQKNIKNWFSIKKKR